MGEHQGNGCHQPQGGGEQGQADVLASIAQLRAAFHVGQLGKGADHADDRAQEADHGGDLGDGEDHRQQEVQVWQDLQFNDIGHGPAHGGQPLAGGFQSCHAEFAGYEARLGGAETDGPLDALFGQLVLQTAGGRH